MNINLILFFILVGFLSDAESFYTGTLVKTKDKYVSINDIKVNDIICNYSFKNKKIEEDKVKTVAKKYTSEWIIILANNTVILSAYDSKFYCPLKKDQWIAAKDLKVDDLVMKNIEDIIDVNHINKVKVKCDIYSLTTEKNHNYFVSTSDIMVY